MVEGEREKKKKEGSLPLDCNGREPRFIAFCRVDADAHTAIHRARYPRIGFQEDGLYEEREGREGERERPFEIYYIRGKREVNREGRDGAEIGGLQDNLCVANY